MSIETYSPSENFVINICNEIGGENTYEVECRFPDEGFSTHPTYTLAQARDIAWLIISTRK